MKKIITILIIAFTVKAFSQETTIKTALSWEKNHPERKEWTIITINTITPLFDSHLSNCTDIEFFRTDYNTLTKQQKIVVWAELISAIAFHESGWKLNSWMIEKTMSNDPITKRQVRSEGLLQLSYQDKLNYPKIPCDFNWETDKNLKDDDINKTIFKAKNNLVFGINILANQINKKNRIALENGMYWSVLSKNGKYSKIKEISKLVNNLKL